MTLTDHDERRVRSVIVEWLDEAEVEDAKGLARKIAANLRPTIDEGLALQVRSARAARTSEPASSEATPEETTLARARSDAMDWLHGVDRPDGLDGRFMDPLGLVRALTTTADERIAVAKTATKKANVEATRRLLGHALALLEELGWHTFGTHAGRGEERPLVFWGEDEGGLPVFEKPRPADATAGDTKADSAAKSSTLCRTCMRPITHETRTEPGYLPREGWYDDSSVDALVCFKARDYAHVPMTDMERAYFDAGYARAVKDKESDRD